MKTYNYEWKTADEIIANLDTKMLFKQWSSTPTSLREILENYADTQDLNEAIANAHKLWLKLKDAFNKEAEVYGEFCDSKLGSVGNIESREVLRSLWWDVLDGDSYGEYGMLTLIIEFLHQGEKLETGIINFGS